MVRFNRMLSIIIFSITILSFSTSFGLADMAADSPVKFPKEGALPSKYPPDRPANDGRAPEEGYYLFSTPERSVAQIDRIQSEMAKGYFTPPPADFKCLPHTRRILTEGGKLNILAIGDSIVNDTMRSGWIAKLRQAYPMAEIAAAVYVRGGGGCQHYKEENRIAKFVIPRKPDLIFIGGISQKDIESIREVILQLRSALPDIEILLATGTFGIADPRKPEELAKAAHSGTGPYGQALKGLAAEQKCAFLDMTTPWAEYIRSSSVHPHVLYRDVVHANEFGEQILCKILMAFWKPDAIEIYGLRKLMDTPLRDTSICRGPDGMWYMTGTVQPFWTYNQGIQVWKSMDLKDWQPLGFVWKYGSSPWHQKYLEAKKPLWAPEIHYLKGTFWMTYSIPGWDGTAKTSGSGLLKSTTGKAEGPYEDMQPNERIGDEIDASLFQDDDGAVYFLWHSGKIARMKPDMSGLTEPYHWLKMTGTDPNPAHHSSLCEGIFGKESFDHVGYEGMFLFKANSRYYLACADQIEGRYSCMISVSNNLFGPYSPRYEAIPHGGHNMFFRDDTGQWWSSYFGSDSTAPWQEKPGILPIHFAPDSRVLLGLDKSAHK